MRSLILQQPHQVAIIIPTLRIRKLRCREAFLSRKIWVLSLVCLTLMPMIFLLDKEVKTQQSLSSWEGHPRQILGQIPFSSLFRLSTPSLDLFWPVILPPPSTRPHCWKGADAEMRRSRADLEATRTPGINDIPKRHIRNTIQ